MGARSEAGSAAGAARGVGVVAFCGGATLAVLAVVLIGDAGRLGTDDGSGDTSCCSFRPPLPVKRGVDCCC